MNNIIKKCRQSYGDMKLSYKFTLVLLLTATVPVVMMACFFYGKLYDMVVSYTIRQEQDTSAQTAPYIEDLVQQIIDAHDGITDQEFFQILFHQPVNSPFQMFLDTNDAQYFHEYVENLIDSDMISGLQIYMDFPPQSVRLFSDDLTKDYFSPMSKARGTYWYGIFQGTQQSPCSVLLSILVNARKKNTEILHILLPRPFIIREKPVRLTSPFTVLQIISQIC